MFPCILLLWSSLAFENSVDKAIQFMTAGNYLMAEAEILQANPEADPVRVAQTLAELAIRMRSVPSKQTYIRNHLLGRYSWKPVAHLALSGLAVHQQDWQAFEDHALALLQAQAFDQHPIRYHLLFHLARHTSQSLDKIPLSASERRWFEACRNLQPNQTMPAVMDPNWPYFLSHGHYLENRTSFTPPTSLTQATRDQDFVAQMIQTRHALNQNDLDSAALAINQMMGMGASKFPNYLKIPFYQLMLEYFQRKGQMENVGKTAENLSTVRNLAFLPFQTWPKRVKTAHTEYLATVQSKPAPPEPEVALAEPTVTLPEPEALPEISEPEAEPTPTTTVPTEAPAPKPVQEPAPAEPDVVTQSEPTPKPVQEPAPAEPEVAAQSEPAPVNTEPTTMTPVLSETPAPPPESLEEVTPSPVTAEETTPEELPSNSEPEPLSDAPPVSEADQRPDVVIPAAPAEPDPNLALARALLADGDSLMAEAQFMAVKPRPQDVLGLGSDLAQLALRSKSFASKKPFFEGYLNRTDPWRGVALTVLAIFAANQQDWAAFEKHTRDLFAEYAPFQESIKYRFIYYLARYTLAEPENLRPQEGLWFQKARDLKPFALWPVCPEANLPFYYQNGKYLEYMEPFEVPTVGDTAQADEVYFSGLLDIRQALNRGDLNGAARGINAQQQLSSNSMDYQWRNLFQELSREYFEKRGETDKAQVAQRNMDLYRQWTVLPIQAFPSRASNIGEMMAKKEDATAAPESDVGPVVDIRKPEPARPKPATPLDATSSWEALEEGILGSSRNLELTIRGKEATTTYERIYKAYLLGSIYMKRGRYQSAYERLTLAESLVRDLPYPNLESKVMLAMADYYTIERNPQQANWYRIAAIQLWNQPSNLPIFATAAQTRSPFPEMLDHSLRKATEKGAIHTLIYYQELGHLLTLRSEAYRRQCLSENGAISQQLTQVGQELKGMVQSLATQSNPDITPRRFNDTQKLWSGLWQSVYPYFRNENVPSLKSIQASLGEDQRLLTFLEGTHFFGVLVISKNQGFAVGLGNKHSFFDLDVTAQFNFLEGRLGPVWTQPGGLILQLSESFRSAELLDQLRQRMLEPQRLQLITSLKAFTLAETRGDCGKVLLVTDQQADRFQLWADAFSGPQTRMTSADGRAAFLQNLEQHRHVVLHGGISLQPEGLHYGAFEFYLHELVRFQPQLCSLTLIAPDGPSLLGILDELAMLQIASAPAIEYRNASPKTTAPFPESHVNIPFQAPQTQERPEDP